jgi:hypothetical protein
MTDHRKLRAAALVYLVGLTLHTVDHLRRGLDVVTEHVFWAGNVSTALGVATVVLILRRHRQAPTAALSFGLPVGIGVAAVHWLPSWGVLSDSFVDNGVSWMSWTVVSIEIAGALAVGLLGLRLVLQHPAMQPR